MLGLSPRVPKFVKRYAELADGIAGAVKAYADDVRARTFPGREHVYAMQTQNGDRPEEATKKPKISGS
jgi:3-methyl-2-oxobutanoate hydroxymethyltransferase